MKRLDRRSLTFLVVALALSFVGVTAPGRSLISGVTFGGEYQTQYEVNTFPVLMWQTLSITIEHVSDGSINIYIMDKNNFDLWLKGKEHTTYFESGTINKEYSAAYRVPLDGTYYVVIQNANSNQQTIVNFNIVSGGPYVPFVIPAVVLYVMSTAWWLRGRHEKREQERLEGEPIAVTTLQSLKKRTRPNGTKRFILLLMREFKNTFSFPIYVIFPVLGILLFGQASRNFISVSSSSSNLSLDMLYYYSARWLLYALSPWFPIVITILTALSITGDMEKGVITNLVTFPIKKHEVITSKFLSLFLVAFSTAGISLLLGFYLNVLRSQLQIPIVFYLVPALVMLILTFLYAAISLLISVLTKRALASALSGIIIFLAWQIFIPNSLSDKTALLLTPQKASEALLFVALAIENPSPYTTQFTFSEAVFAFTWMLALTLSCLIASFLIFQKKQF